MAAYLGSLASSAASAALPYLPYVAGAGAAWYGGRQIGGVAENIGRNHLAIHAPTELQSLLNAIRGQTDAAASPADPAASALQAHTITRIPRRVLQNIRDQITTTLALAVGSGQPLTQAISAVDRTRLEELRDAITPFYEGDPHEEIDFSPRREVFQTGLRAAAHVIEQNSSSLTQAIDGIRLMLLNAQRAANADCRHAHHILSNVLRNRHPSLSADQRLELLGSLNNILRHPGVLDGTPANRADIQALSEALEREEAFPVVLARTVHAEITETIRIQSGEVEQLLGTLRNGIFDPNSGLLREAMDAVLGEEGLLEQVVGDAPPTMIGVNDAVLRLFDRPLKRTQLAQGYFQTLRYYFASAHPTYLGRELQDAEKGIIQGAYAELAKPLFANRPTRREFETFAAHINTLREYAENAENPLNGINRARLIERIERFQALRGFYDPAAVAPDEYLELPADYQNHLRILAQYLVKTQVFNPELRPASLACTALEAMTLSEEMIQLRPEVRGHVERLSEHLHATMTSRSGQVWTSFYNLRRAILHPQQGLLPQMTREYLNEVGRDAIRAIQTLDTIATGRHSRDEFREAFHKLRDFAHRFDVLMQREPSECEARDLDILLRTLHQAIQNGEYDNFSASPNYSTFLEAKGRLTAAVENEQGLIQRQVLSLVTRVEELLGGTLGRVDRFTRVVRSDNPLLQVRDGLQILIATIRGGARGEFERDRTRLLSRIEPILRQAENPAAIERIIGRPRRECREILEQLGILHRVISRLERFPTREESEEVIALLTQLQGHVHTALSAHPDYGDGQRMLDGFSDAMAQRAEVAANIAYRRLGSLGGLLGGAIGHPEPAEDAPPAPPSHSDHPAFRCMQNAILLFNDSGLRNPQRNQRLQEELGRINRAIEERTVQLIGERQGHDAAWGRNHLHLDRDVFLTSLAQALKEDIDTKPIDKRRFYYLKLYESAPGKPDLSTDDEKIAWAQRNRGISPVQLITAYAVTEVHDRRAAPAMAAARRDEPRAVHAPRGAEGEGLPPEAAAPAGIGAVCGGLFSGALHFIQNAPNVMAQFSLDAFARFIQFHLDTTVLNFVRQFRDLDPAQRETIITAVQAGARRLEEARVVGSSEGYQAALREVAVNLSRYSILLNGTAIIPSFGEAYRADALRDIEERRIAEAERVNPDHQDENPDPPAVRVNRAKEEFKDITGMYATFMYVIGSRAGERNRTQELLEEIHNDIQARVEFVRDNPPGSRGYREEFDRIRAERIAEFAAVERDTTLEEIMQEVSRVERPEDRTKRFKALLHEKIDERTDISWPFKMWLKFVTIPLCMTFVPFFVGRTIDSFLWKVRTVIHNAAQRENGSPVTVIDTKIIKEVTNFLAKYRNAIDAWAERGGESREDAVERFLFRKDQNNGWEMEEVYDKLGDLLVGKFFVDTSIEEGPGKAAGDWFKVMVTVRHPATPLGIFFNIVEFPFRLVGGFLMGSFWGIMFGGAIVGQSIWNSASRFVMKKVVMTTQLIQQLTDTASNSLYSETYMSTLNRLLVRQLKEGWKLLRINEKDNATDKSLQLVPRIVDNPAAPVIEALNHLDSSWAHLKTKLPDDDPRIQEFDREIAALSRLMGEDGAPRGIEAEEYRRRLKEVGRRLWSIHTEFRSENLADKYPDRTKQAVSELIQHAIVVLDKRTYLDPERAREGGIADSIRNGARAMFLDQAVDSISGLILVACETFFKDEFLESQLATALESANDTMYHRDPPQDEVRALANHEVEQQVSHLVDMIIRSTVNATIDGAGGSLRDSKIQLAKETIDWIKITFSEGVGLRCKAPTPNKKIIEKWETKLREYAANQDVEKLNEMHALLRQLLTEIRNKGRELELNREMSEQMKRHLGESRDQVVQALHRLQDSLTPLLDRARSEGIAHDVEEHTESMAAALSRAQEQINEFSPEGLAAIPQETLDGLRAHADATLAAIGHIERPEARLQSRIARAQDQAGEIQQFAARIVLHQGQAQTLEGLRGLVGTYADARRRGMIEEGRAQGAAAVAAPVAGGNADANRISREIDAAIEALGREVPFDREAMRVMYRRILSARTPEQVVQVRGEFIDFIERSIRAERTQVIEQRDALSTSLERASISLRQYNELLRNGRGGDGAPAIDALIANVQADLGHIREVVEGITYPPLLNIDLVDLSPGSMASEWIKGFVYMELKKRAEQAVRFTQDRSAFNGAMHHTAVGLLKVLADPVEVRRHNQDVAAGG